MKKIIMVLVVLLTLGGCMSAPSVWKLDENVTIEEAKHMYKQPDTLIHVKKGDHSFETWIYNSGIKLVFEDGNLINWNN